MKFRIDYNLDLSTVHQLAVLYLYERERSNATDFKTFCKDQIEMFGLEACGLGESNGYGDYSNKLIAKACDFILFECNELSNGTIIIWRYDSEDEYEIVFSPRSWRIK